LAEIKWHNEKRAIRDLIPYEVNPRQITNKQAKDLKASLAKFGIADPIIINTDNMIIGGHQRKKILETLLGYDPDYQIDVRVPDRELSIDEARELNVRLNKNVADWDFDILANNFELDDLLDWGFSPSELGITPDADEWGAAMDKLPDEDRAPFQQMTFTLHDTQAETVKDALTASKALGAFVETENENSNGNALARICEMFLEENGRG